MKSFGYSRCSGFIGSPLISKNLSAIGSGSPSFGLPNPSNTLPSTSFDTGISITLPTNFAFVPELIIQLFLQRLEQLLYRFLLRDFT